MEEVPGTFSCGTSLRQEALIFEIECSNSIGSWLIIKIVAYFFAPVSPIVVLTVPNVFFVGSSAEVAPRTVAVTTHQVHPVVDATCTAPQENFSQTGIPSICLANARVKFLSFDASPTNSFAVGIFA